MSDDPFTSIQWDDKNNDNTNDKNNDITHDNINDNNNLIDNNTTTINKNDSLIEDNSLNDESNINNNDLEGSGLITQTMILGAENDTKEDTKEAINNIINEEPKTGLENEVISNDNKITDVSNNLIDESEHLKYNNHTNGDTTTNSTDNNDNTIYKLNIKVTNPVTEHHGSNSFTIYHIEIETNNPKLSKEKYTILRRYSDFDTLYQCLSFDHPTLLIPPLPNKQRLEYIKGGRFTEEFVLKRCNSLNVFLNRIIKHPILSKSEVLMVFLEDNDYWNTYKSNLQLNDVNSIIHSNPSVEGVTDFLMNSFKKPHIESKFNKNFQEIDHQRLNLQDNLNKIDKIYAKVVNKQESISKELNSFGDEFNKLTILLNNDFDGKHRTQTELDYQTKIMVDEFKSFSENLKKSGNYYDELNKFIEFNYLNNLKDLEHYLISLGNLIKLKDNKVVDYEMLDNYLEKAISERDNLIHGGSLTSTTEGTISYLSRKFEFLTGFKGSSLLPSSSSSTSNNIPNNNDQQNNNNNDINNPDLRNKSSLVNERIEKLNNRISLLEKEKIKAKQVYEKFEKDLLEEWVEFQKIKDDEISDSLNNLSNEYINLYSKSFNDWNDFEIKKESFKLDNKLNDETKDKYFNHSAVLKNDDEIKDLLKGIDI